MSKMKLLFVDDEERVLDGLRRALRPLQDNWDLQFVTSGEAALQKLEESPYDLVVSDVRMPEMDGVQLLEKIRIKHPEPIRVILSGHSQQVDTLRSTNVAHRYLSKPCDADELREIVEKSVALRTELADPQLMAAIATTNTLPTVPSLYQRLMQEVTSGDPSMSAIAGIVSQDIGLTAKILQIVNSAFFALRRHITDINQAVNYLGIDTIMALTLTTQLFGQRNLTATQRATLERVWRHSLGVATMAKAVAVVEGYSDSIAREAFLAGMLHDAGHLVFTMNWPDRVQDEDDMPPLIWERETFGADHCFVGAYLLSTWGLPDEIVEAVAYHQEPSRAEFGDSPALIAVHVADALELRDDYGGIPPLDEPFLEKQGLAENIDSWIKMADVVQYERENVA